MSLCQLCQNFDLQSFSWDSDGLRGYEVEAMRAGEEAGCDLCILLAQNLPPVLNGTWIHFELLQDNTRCASRKEKTPLRANRLSVAVGDRIIEKINKAQQATFRLAADPRSPAAQNQDIVGRYLGENQASPEHFNYIRDWMANCVQHKKCNITFSGASSIQPGQVPLPTRCLEVSKDNVILRETGGGRGAYIIVSHRWNPETQKCQTTTSNYESRTRGNDFRDLPQMFQDVFTVARELCIQYIWIDSLCIIQEGNKGQDWAREAVKMAGYYQNAILTLSSTTTESSQSLFRTKLQTGRPILASLPYRDTNGTHRGQFFIYRLEKQPEKEYDEDIRQSVLLSRGWVFQERVLSRRSIYYSPSGVYFECQTDHPRSERNDEVYTNNRLDLPGVPTRRLWQILSFDKRLLGHWLLFDQWYHLIQTYSGMDFSKPEEDRLIAISGVAKEFQQLISARSAQHQTIMPGLYCSGLWLEDIHFGLLWTSNVTSTSISNRKSSAPSWSWGSTFCRVEWAKRTKHPCEPGFRLLGLRSGKFQYMFENATQKEPRGNNDSEPVIVDSLEISQLLEVEHVFVGILIEGKTQPVVIRGYLRAEAAVNARLATGIHRRAKTWTPKSRRAICSETGSDQGIVGGWCVLDSNPIQEQLLSYKGTVVWALHVSTARHEGALGIGSRPLVFGGHVYNVLLVEKVDKGSFRRLGVGKIFEDDLIDGFRNTQMENIWLV